MKPYEVMFILDPVTVPDDAVDSRIERVTNLIVQQGGKVTGIDKWGRRRFAYEIKGRTEGYYVVMTFQAGRETVAELNRVLRLSDNVIRHMIVALREGAKAAASDGAAQAEAAANGAAEKGAQAGPEAGGAQPGEALATEAAEATT